MKNGRTAVGKAVVRQGEDQAMKEDLQLSFLTDLSKTVHLLVPNPVQPVSASAVSAAMDAIVAANIFAFPTGRIVKKVAARLNTTDASPIQLV